MTAERNRFSGFGDVDRAPDPAKYVRRLDRTGGTPFWQAIKRQMIARLDLAPGQRVLDLGCGTGEDARHLARLVAPEGRVVGIDRSWTMLDEARDRLTRDPVPLDLCLVDAARLGFPDDSFDACRCERVLQHLEDPARAIAELARVARPGRPVVVVEPDYGTLTIRGADRDVTRRVLACRLAHFRFGRVGRELPRLFSRAGLTEVGVTLLVDQQTHLTIDGLDHLRTTYLDPAREAGVITPAEAERWIPDLTEAAQRGTFRLAVTVFLVWGRKRHVSLGATAT